MFIRFITVLTLHGSDTPAPKKSKRTFRFATLQSMTPTTLKDAEKEWKREVKRNKYRQFPHPNQAFGALGTFHWPVSEWRPEQTLGPSYEALDPIRMDCSCYVVFRPELSAFQIMGKAEDVKTGVSRLRKTCFQLAAREVPRIRLCLPHWAHTDQTPTHVVLASYSHAKALVGQQTPQKIVSNMPMGEGTAVQDSSLSKYAAASESHAYSHLVNLIPKMRYYRGSIQMRIRLGKFLAKQFLKAEKNTYTLKQYETMTKQSQFVGEVTIE